MRSRYQGFDRDFQRLRMPALVRAVQWWASLCAENWVSFSDAVGEVMATAMALDAGWLSETACTDLEEWVIDQVGAVVDAELPP